MADALLMYGVATGIFVFLVAVVFGARGARKRRGSSDHMEHSSSSGNEGKRKKLRSDGTPA